MIYQEIRPSPALAEYVQTIYVLEAGRPDEIMPRQRIMPDGIIELVFHFGRPFITYDAQGCAIVQPRSFAISQMRQCIEIQSRGDSGFVAVRFYPWGAYHFFDVPISEFLDESVSAEHLWRSAYREIEDRICQARNNAQRFHIIERFLIKQLTCHNRQGSSIDGILRYIRQTHGTLPINELCRRTGFSKKQLERAFLASVGAPPKTFSRMTRFLHACRRIPTSANRSFTQLAYECGYYDQAHFIRDFREFSGMTPGEFFASQNVSWADF